MIYGREPILPIDVDLIGDQVKVENIGCLQQETFRTIDDNVNVARANAVDINST
jgi:hypothetical protein